MTAESWASGLADDEDLAGILQGVPGPMCSKIDTALRNGEPLRNSPALDPQPADLGRKPHWISHDEVEEGDDVYTERDFGDAWSTAEQAIAERDRAREGLEECRTALEVLREALREVVDLYKVTRGRVGGA